MRRSWLENLTRRVTALVRATEAGRAASAEQVAAAAFVFVAAHEHGFALTPFQALDRVFRQGNVSPWKAAEMATAAWSRWQESNLRYRAPKARALPLGYIARRPRTTGTQTKEGRDCRQAAALLNSDAGSRMPVSAPLRKLKRTQVLAE